MKYASEPSWAILRKLREAVRPAGLFRREGDPIPHLSALIEGGEAGVLKDLIAIAFEADPKWRGRCVSAVSVIAGPMIPDRLPEWDEFARRSGSIFSQSGGPWYTLKKESIEQLPLATSADIILLGLCASHPNGYIRESVVRRLARIENGEEFPFLVLRANDWVTAVQIRASTALIDRLRPSYGKTVFRHLTFLDFLGRAHRIDQRPLLDAINIFLRSVEIRPALLDGLDTQNYRIRRRCFELAFGVYNPWPEWLVEKALGDLDVVIRYEAFKQLLIPGAAPSATRIDGAARDSFARIRRLAFNCCVERDTAADPEQLKVFLFDRSAQLRRDAQRRWLRMAFGDPADVYRSSLKRQDASNEAQGLAGLGETGAAADSELVKSFLRHRHSRTRRAAIQAICRLKPTGFLDIVTETLFNDSPSVAGAAACCLQAHIRVMSPDRLWERALATPRLDSEVRVLRLFRRLAKWDRLECLLRAIVTSDLSPKFTLSELEDWNARFNREFTTATLVQHVTLVNLLAQASPQLGNKLSSQIEFVLRQK